MRRKTKGFTIIEVLIVVLILSTLVTLSIPMMQGVMIRPWISKSMLDVDQIRKAVRFYIADDENAAWAQDSSILITKDRPGTNRDAGYDIPDDNINFYYEARWRDDDPFGFGVTPYYVILAYLQDGGIPLLGWVIFQNSIEVFCINEDSPLSKYVPSTGATINPGDPIPDPGPTTGMVAKFSFASSVAYE